MRPEELKHKACEAVVESIAASAEQLVESLRAREFHHCLTFAKQIVSSLEHLNKVGGYLDIVREAEICRLTRGIFNGTLK